MSIEKLEKHKEVEDEAWNLIQVYQEQEKKLKSKMEERLSSEVLQYWISQITIPMNQQLENYLLLFGNSKCTIDKNRKVPFFMIVSN